MEFPKEKYEGYLKVLGIWNGKKMNEKQIETVFLLAREDFINYRLSLDELSSICQELSRFVEKDINIMTGNLATVLDLGLELSWYVRQKNKKTLEKFSDFLFAILKYKKS